MSNTCDEPQRSSLRHVLPLPWSLSYWIWISPRKLPYRWCHQISAANSARHQLGTQNSRLPRTARGHIPNFIRSSWNWVCTLKALRRARGFCRDTAHASAIQCTVKPVVTLKRPTATLMDWMDGEVATRCSTRRSAMTSTHPDTPQRPH